jgi:carbohydrate diacid regulator
MNPLEINMPSAAIMHAVADIVKPHNLLIANPEGIIVASSDEERIGTYHAGAFDAARERTIVEITEEDAHRYEGSIPGINSPIIKNNKVLGVIGISGNPQDVRQISTLIVLTTNLFLERSTEDKRNERRKEIREALTELILGNSQISNSEFWDLSKLLGVEYISPVTPILINTPKDNLNFHTVLENFKESGILDPSKDLILKINDGYFFLKSHIKGDVPTFMQSIIDSEDKLGIKIIKVASGYQLNEENLLYQSYLVTQAFKNCIYQKKIYCAADPDDLVLVDYSNSGYSLARIFVLDIIEIIDAQTSSWIYDTMEAYLHEDGRIQGIADYLGIHKNTCIYRVNKILKISGFQNCRTFTIAHFFGVILQIKRC